MDRLKKDKTFFQEYTLDCVSSYVEGNHVCGYKAYLAFFAVVLVTLCVVFLVVIRFVRVVC